MSSKLTKPFKPVRLIEQIKEELALSKSPKKPSVSRHQFSADISENSDIESDSVFKEEFKNEIENIKNEVSEESDDELEFEKKIKTGELKVNQIETKCPKIAKTKSAYWNDMIGSTDSESDEDSYSYKKKSKKSEPKPKLSQGKRSQMHSDNTAARNPIPRLVVLPSHILIHAPTKISKTRDTYLGLEWHAALFESLLIITYIRLAVQSDIIMT